jgi:hypothetical protein
LRYYLLIVHEGLKVKQKLMKKSILLVACVTLLTVGAISVSCSKDDDWKGCRCTFTYADGGQGTHTESAAELKEHGINSCAEYKEWTEEDSYLSNVRCSDL